MTSPAAAANEITHWGAVEIARRVARREVSATEVTRAFIQRIEAVNPLLNAVVVRLFDEALVTARQRDEESARGKELGPLHGVPLTVKECFQVAGTPSTIGIEAYKDELFHDDALLVHRLREAGSILLGKTNVPQMMIWHECDNPVYGRTNNPWDLARTPGGSTGGEGAIVAARGSPLGLGNDLGGSIRVPCHFCGIAGIKPTSLRLPRGGTRPTLRGMEAMVAQAGPMARKVEDLSLALRVLTGELHANHSSAHPSGDISPYPLRDPAAVRVENLRIGVWANGYFPASTAVQRAVHAAAEALRERGATIVPFEPPGIAEIVETYVSLMGADGGASARRITQGSPLDWRVARLIWMAGLRRPARWAMTKGLRAMGQEWMARLVSLARPRSADGYWQLIDRKNRLVAAFMQQCRTQMLDAFLAPVHALPAMQHGKPIDLIIAASYSFVTNLLGIPAGVVPITRVREGEDATRPASRDKVLRQAAAVDRGSVGLPIAVQVSAGYWREDIVLALLSALEQHFTAHSDYPGHADVPTLGS
jgi:fatty acid amide hydrolase